MNLTHLSLQRAPRLHKQMPHAPNNEPRLREFRKVAPVERHNGFRWPFHGSQPVGFPAESPNVPAGCFLSDGERYAMEQTMDGPPPVIPFAARRGI